MTRTASSTRMIALVASTALASLALGGCATQAAPRADLSASKAQQALQKGRGSQAVSHAEAAVLADPHNASYRAMLGAAYMEEGRFQSAATSFQDALTLGDMAPKTALSLALAQIASGNNRAALSTLSQWQDSIDQADLGLALALAGDTRRGVDVLSAQLRGGNNTPKVRQNLAYSYALLGDWRAARVMAAEDVPADQLDARLSEWAAVGRPEDHQARVAALLSVPVVGDSGQPAALALGNNPGTTGLAMEAARELPATSELPPVMAEAAPQSGYPLPVAPRASAPASDFSSAFAEPAPIETVSNPVVQPVRPTTTGTPRRSGRTVAAAPAAAEPATQASFDPAPVAKTGTHLIQLGSFSSEASAKRAWSIYAKRYPQLSAHDMVITKAVVRGKTYWRVSAAGFERASASSMCSTVKRGGEGCIAWAANKPLPGAVDTGVRMAAR
ncbi:MAG: SPOR domain-containing protein [Sphingomonadaceae bacterium]|nr:SPOR domain-containing protein [Sphingomonadaceae bacterium]